MSKFDNMLADFNASENIPVITANSGGSGRYSFGVVNSAYNGKRITISKALVKKLGLNDIVYLAPVPQRGILMMASNIPSPKASQCALRGTDKKIGYAAEIVQMVTKVFNLDFSEHVSRSFSNVEFEDVDGTCVAYVHMDTPIVSSGTASSSDED